jgi:hypothetical protein
MTPPAAAVAETLPRQRPGTRRATPVRHPRRISGPARPSAPGRPARPLAAPGRPGRARARPRTATRPAARTQSRGLALRAYELYTRVCDSALLGRLVSGRLWIGLLAFSLIGIVAMQLVVLRLNSGIGATLARAAALQRADAQLGIEAATGSGEGRIEPLAAATGMTFAPPGSVRFLAASGSADVARAAAALAAPIQPREYAPSGSEGAASGAESAAGTGEAATGSGTGEAGAGSGAGESASGQSGSGEAAGAHSEAGAGASGSGESASGSGASGESSGAREASGAPAGAPSAGEPEASASAAGGVAAGH